MKVAAQSVKTQISLITYEKLIFALGMDLSGAKFAEKLQNCSTDHATNCSVCRKQLLHDHSSLREKVTADAGQ